jgi:hypothetical protein
VSRSDYSYEDGSDSEDHSVAEGNGEREVDDRDDDDDDDDDDDEWEHEVDDCDDDDELDGYDMEDSADDPENELDRDDGDVASTISEAEVPSALQLHVNALLKELMVRLRDVAKLVVEELQGELAKLDDTAAGKEEGDRLAADWVRHHLVKNKSTWHLLSHMAKCIQLFGPCAQWDTEHFENGHMPIRAAILRSSNGHKDLNRQGQWSKNGVLEQTMKRNVVSEAFNDVQNSIFDVATALHVNLDTSPETKDLLGVFLARRTGHTVRFKRVDIAALGNDVTMAQLFPTNECNSRGILFGRSFSQLRVEQVLRLARTSLGGNEHAQLVFDQPVASCPLLGANGISYDIPKMALWDQGRLASNSSDHIRFVYDISTEGDGGLCNDFVLVVARVHLSGDVTNTPPDRPTGLLVRHYTREVDSLQEVRLLGTPHVPLALADDGDQWSVINCSSITHLKQRHAVSRVAGVCFGLPLLWALPWPHKNPKLHKV